LLSGTIRSAKQEQKRVGDDSDESAIGVPELANRVGSLSSVVMGPVIVIWQFSKRSRLWRLQESLLLCVTDQAASGNFKHFQGPK
jgi:hypothetical protein